MSSKAPTLTISQFESLLPKICDNKTSSDPDNWTPENPLWGHCAVVSLITQNLFGGTLLRASLENTRYAGMRSHYWNKLLFYSEKNPLGEEKDFTAPQFTEGYPAVSSISEKRERSYLLSNPETVKRYKLLAWRLAKELNRGNVLFNSSIYQKCFFNALESPCQKMKFGVVIVHQPTSITYEFVSEGCNRTIEPLKSLCEPTCIRFNIPSRTDSMIGACSHAEESALWNAVKMRIPLKECSLYVAGVYPNGLPHFRKTNEFTCLRCAVQLYLSEIKIDRKSVV